MMTEPHVGQRFSTDQGTLVFTVSEIRQRTIHFAAIGDTAPRRINRERWGELFAEGTLREVAQPGAVGLAQTTGTTVVATADVIR